jgi:hypothetical protein
MIFSQINYCSPFPLHTPFFMVATSYSFSDEVFPLSLLMDNILNFLQGVIGRSQFTKKRPTQSLTV